MNKFVLCAILTSFISLSIHAAESNKPTTGGGGSGGGWRESYGGDSTVMEFKHLAKEMAYVLNDNSFPNKLDLDFIALKEVINLSHVECGSDLILDGESKDAINYPHETPQRITFNCKKWNDELSTAQKYRLAIHEYLPLIGIDDSSYTHSETMFNFFIKYKNSLNFDMKDMMTVIMNCSVKRFRDLTNLGGNVFLENARDINLLQISTVFGCETITQDLIDSGLEYVTNKNITVPYGHYGLIESAMRSSQQERQYIGTLKILIKKWPGLPQLGFTDLLWFSSDYRLKKECFPGSTIMHLLATQEEQITQENYNFIKQIIDLGFSLDQKNSCNQTPRALFEKRNIHF